MLNDWTSDAQIVRKVLNGDIESFRLIVSRYQAYIYRIGMTFFKSEDDSRDFVQDVFLKAYNELESYKGKAPFRAWLVRIAYNYGINEVKVRKADEMIFEDSMSDKLTPEEIHVRDETIDMLYRAIDDLPNQYRICVDLYFFGGFRYIDIENITGYPVNTVKSNVLRAKRILRDRLRGSIAEDYHEM